MAMTEFEQRRNGQETLPQRVGGRLRGLKELIVGPPLRPVTARIDWHESLRSPDIKKVVLFAAQTHLVEGVDEEGTRKIIEQLGYPLERAEVGDIFEAASNKLIRELPARELPTGGQIEIRTIDGEEAIFTPFDLEIEPKDLEKIGMGIGFETFLSAVYKYENWPRRGSRSFTHAVIDGKEVPLWERRWGEIYPRPPQEVFTKPMSQLNPGETVQFVSGRGDLTANLTALPLKPRVPMAEFVLAVDEQKAPSFGNALDVARAQGQAMVWIVDHFHEGLLEAAFWKNVKGGRRPLLDIVRFRQTQPTEYRLFKRSPEGWLSGIDGTSVKGRSVPREFIPGSMDLLVEVYDGNLEERYRDYMEKLAERAKHPNSYDRHIQGVAEVGVADVRQSGRSLRKIHAEAVVPITPAPSMFTTFKAA